MLLPGAMEQGDNFSVVVDREQLQLQLITAHHGVDKGAVTSGDLIVVNAEGKVAEKPLASGRASAETEMHLRMGVDQCDAGAVLHTHSINATWLSRNAMIHQPLGQQTILVLEGWEMMKASTGLDGRYQHACHQH